MHTVAVFARNVKLTLTVGVLAIAQPLACTARNHVNFEGKSFNELMLRTTA